MTRKILLVEDNPADAELVRIVAAELGLDAEVLHAQGSDEVFEILDHPDMQHSSIAFVLLDLNMPRVSGIEILQRIRKTERYALLPVIIFTSSANKTDILSCYGYGANAYVCKPIDFMEFSDTISTIANFWLYSNILPRI
jgi:two-component system, response regulator